MTAGTVFHGTKTPLTVWFWAAYLMTTDKRGISALLRQRQLGLRRYETAWRILHKLRRAMVNATREPLHGEVELDDTWVGGPQPGLRGSRQMEAVGKWFAGLRGGEGDVLMPDGPDDAGQFIGHRAGGLVISATVGDGDRPRLDRRERLVGSAATIRGRQHGARPMGQQIPEIAVAPFTNAAQVAAARRRMLTRRQPQPPSELARAPEGVDRADAPHERRRRQEADAGNRLQLDDDGVGGGEGAQLLLDGGDPVLEVPDFRVDTRQRLAQRRRQRDLGIFEQGRHLADRRRARPPAAGARARAAVPAGH